MSENTVTIDPSRITVSDRALERTSDPAWNRSEDVEQNSQTGPPAGTKSAPSRVNASSGISTPSVTFVIDQDSGESFIQVIDRDSGEILRQIPPEEARELAEALEEMIGNVVDTLA